MTEGKKTERGGLQQSSDIGTNGVLDLRAHARKKEGGGMKRGGWGGLREATKNRRGDNRERGKGAPPGGDKGKGSSTHFWGR